MSTKYNDGASISISSLPKDEIKQAFKEWSEGDEELEKLLFQCYSNNIETIGCHSDSSDSFLQVIVNNSYNEIKRMLCSLQTVHGVRILVEPNGSSNILYPGWDTPIITFGLKGKPQSSADSLFYKLSESITNYNSITPSKTKPFEYMLDFYDFFVGKEADLNFELKYLKNDQYIFSVNTIKDRSDLNSLNDLFIHAGLTKDDNSYGRYNEWNLVAKTLEELDEKMLHCTEVIINEWPLSLPSEIVEGMSANAIAHFMKRKFGNSSEGQQKFNEWLNNYREEIIQKNIRHAFEDSAENQQKFEEWLKDYREKIGSSIVSKGDETSQSSVNKNKEQDRKETNTR